jgi:DNA repair photolyase
MEKKFWKPSITSQFMVCPIPYHLDTYRGCTYRCLYCFARDFVTFSRRNSEHKEFSYLVGNRADSIDRWIERTLNNPYDYTKSEEVALKERIPIKIGATSDPFPKAELEHRVTYDVLKVFDKYDYPIEIQTKNPSVLAEYSGDFKNPNWIIAVTLISTDQDFIKVVEPNAPTPKERLSAIKKLTDEGKKVMVKIQPSIYPKILKDLPDLVKSIKESGCVGFNTEGLKIRTTMPESERALFDIISKVVGYDLREYYKENGVRTGSDYEMTIEKKLEYTNMAWDLAKKYSLKYWVADNSMGKIGDSDECCGTEFLRGYKKWGDNTRSVCFDKCPSKCSSELGKCLVNFTRSQGNRENTMKEVFELKTMGKKKVQKPTHDFWKCRE